MDAQTAFQTFFEMGFQVNFLIMGGIEGLAAISQSNQEHGVFEDGFNGKGFLKVVIGLIGVLDDIGGRLVNAQDKSGKAGLGEPTL